MPSVVSLAVRWLCLVGTVAGVLVALSPLWVDGGAVGWSRGYKHDPNRDILLIDSAAGLTYAFFSVGLGVVVAIVSGFVGSGIGLTFAIVNLVRATSGKHSASNEVTPPDH